MGKEKVVIEKIKPQMGNRHITFSEQALEGYPDGVRALLMCIAETGYRAGEEKTRIKYADSYRKKAYWKKQAKNWEKLYKNELSEKESRKQREIKLAEINAEKEFNDGNEDGTYSYIEYKRLRNQCRLLLEKNKQLKKQYKDLREKVLDRGYMK